MIFIFFIFLCPDPEKEQEKIPPTFGDSFGWPGKLRKAHCDYDAALVLLDKWTAARPLLRVGQSAYARRLVLRMIGALERIHLYGEGLSEDERSCLAWLRNLLNDQPPSHDPPTAKPLPEGLFLFYVTPDTFSATTMTRTSAAWYAMPTMAGGYMLLPFCTQI